MVGSSRTSRLLLMNPRPWQIRSTLSKWISNSSLIFSGEMRSASLNLLTALISVEESRVGIAKGKSLEALTVAATVFLPFTLVASIMSINGAFAPGQAKHWVFWAFSIPISLVVVIFHLIYRKVGSVK